MISSIRTAERIYNLDTDVSTFAAVAVAAAVAAVGWGGVAACSVGLHHPRDVTIPQSLDGLWSKTGPETAFLYKLEAPRRVCHFVGAAGGGIQRAEVPVAPESGSMSGRH
jgi:hypothetical protein